jgi:hypothetical protein
MKVAALPVMSGPLTAHDIDSIKRAACKEDEVSRQAVTTFNL